MVMVSIFKPGEYMINVTKEEALLIIKSLATQLYGDNCNRNRAEFGKHHKGDAEYFSIAVDESASKFNVMTNLIHGNPINDVIVNRFDTLKEAQEFMIGFDGKEMIKKDSMWIKEVIR